MIHELTLERWDGMRQQEREALARRLARELPEGFAFEGLRSFALGMQRHEIAEFRFEEASFMLVPGGTIRLGYDSQRPWEPTPAERESWLATAEDYGIDATVHEYLAAMTLPPRTLKLQPFLLETSAAEPGWRELSPQDPEVAEIVVEYTSKHPNSRRMELYQGDRHIRIDREAGGALRVQSAQEQTHEGLIRELARAGFRLPSSDEWEYACGAGADTLFRWGDHVPCDRYPTDVSPEEAAWRRRWVLSGGTLAYPSEGFASDWSFHRRPNAFGISIASDPYKYELVGEPGLTRGGDGGCTICGGMGFFVGWLTLATAFFEPQICRQDPKEPILTGYTIARRALGLG